MSKITPITVAYGDGIGPEIMQAVLHILMKAEANIRVEVVEVGEKLYKKNYTSGIAPDTWESIERTRILLKAPITTPQGGGYKSLNVTMRKTLGLYANVRPSISYHPFVNTLHPDLDLVIVRENEEDLYAGIEYRHTHNMRESVKLISRTGCEKIVRYAFEYAIKNSRKKVTCFSKDNIMKFSDGIFHQVFNEIAKEYPTIANEHYIVDIGTARLATKPEIFDVIVTSNLFGDIISDVTAEISGSVGLAGSANIGKDFALFEAIHGSAPDIAGKNIANPSGLLNGAIMMLVHIGQGEVAAEIENAWKKTLEDGVHTADIYNTKISNKKVGTKEFAEEVVSRLGQKPSNLRTANYSSSSNKAGKNFTYEINMSEKKSLVGVDIFVGMNVNSAHDIAER
jgi:isocitrate dehydrogenase